ncbi:MAG TPA: AI-2E family transporter [Thermoanaerobaculia bacterium]|jgi:predicted PurR-regulated permease PerM|nr:AI-2E family transporter [Thermoanaerobaculia bacterium]
MLEATRKDPSKDKDPQARPDIRKLRDLLERPFGVRSFALTGLFILAAFYTLYLGRTFFLPIVLSLLLSFLLRPVVRALKKIHIPEALSAGVLILGLLGLLGLGIFELAAPAYTWIGQAPQSLHRIEGRLRDLKRPVQTVSKATEQVERIAKVGGTDATPKVQVTQESLGARVFSGATEFAVEGLVLFILLFFLLASGDLFLRKLIKVLPSLADKKRAVDIASQIETEISTYLTTITVINIVLGLAVWGAMALIGVPNPLLWGVVAAVLNFVPFLGPITMVSVLTMVGLLIFPDLPHALIAPGVFLGLHFLESYLLTPMILGRRLTLNPVVIFLGLTFWGWLWGIAGAILAVPIMMVLKIFCEHSEPLASIGEFLGE